MFPDITIFGRTFGLYGLIAIAAGMLVGVIACRHISKKGLDDNDAIVYLLLVALGVLFGGHFLYALTNLSYMHLFLEVRSFNDFANAASVVFGGSVFYGGLIGGTIVGAIVIRKKKLPRALYMDLTAPMAALFHGFARIGCFFGGCCYGIESDFDFVVHNNPYLPELNDVRRFPVQLLESAGEFLLFLLLWLLYKKIWEKGESADKAGGVMALQGKLFPLYLSLYAILRFFDEFLRGDVIRGFLFGGVLSTSQFISILIEIAAILWLILSRPKRSTVPKAA